MSTLRIHHSSFALLSSNLTCLGPEHTCSCLAIPINKKQDVLCLVSTWMEDLQMLGIAELMSSFCCKMFKIIIFIVIFLATVLARIS